MNKSEDTYYEGLEVIGGHCSEDPFKNLLSYAKENLEKPIVLLVEDYVKILKNDMAQNHALKLQFTPILQKISDPEQKKVLRALLQDIPVFFLRQRYDLLRQVFTPDMQKGNCNDLLENYWLHQTWNVDPEVPNIVARYIVSRLSQWDLMCLLYDKIKNISQNLTKEEDSESPDTENLQRLGRLIAFLRWVPYNWTEEVLLELPDNCPLKKGSHEHLRLWVSVMRAFYCRVRNQKKTLPALCSSLFAHFDGKIPMDLRQYVQAVFISGGRNAWLFLENQVLIRPDIFLNRFFLITMTYIDRVATAHFLHDNNDVIKQSLSPKDYILLFANIGECDTDIIKQIEQYWNEGDESLQMSILELILEFHWKEIWPFLVEQVSKSTSVLMKMKIYEAIVKIGAFDDAIQLLPALNSQHPVVYYHVIEQFHHLLLEHPIMLTRLQDISILAVFESARQRIYSLYRLLFDYKKMLEAMSRIIFTLEQEKIDTITIPEDFRIEANASEQAIKDTVKKVSADPVVELLYAIKSNHHWHKDNLDMLNELADILEYLTKAKPQNKNSIYGFLHEWKSETRLLEKPEFLVPYENCQTEQLHADLMDRLKKAEQSITFFREYFLYKEWFIRRTPFILHEQMHDLVDKINTGAEIDINPDELKDEKYQEYLRKTFEIFYECTKQGVYLTDELLNYLLNLPLDVIHGRLRVVFTRRRSLITRGAIPYDPEDAFDRHLQFTTFAHIYRYGKESMGRPPIIYLWLRYVEASNELIEKLRSNEWPLLPPHPQMQTIVGPCVQKMYKEQIDDATRFLKLVTNIFDHFQNSYTRIRVIPNITYGLFCLAPVMSKIHKSGLHISLAGISSRYCDNININEFSVKPDALFPVKPYLFSTASNFGTVNHDRILIVLDGTMEPVDRRDPHKIRLPKAHRGYINHLVAVNYIRSKYAYDMENPERGVASAMHLSVRYVRNLIRTPKFKQLVDNLFLSFDREELREYHRKAGTGRTYYSFAQWNPDGLTTELGSRGDTLIEVPCIKLKNLVPPVLLFVSMNGIMGKNKVPAFFDNNPEVEKSRIIIGPTGVWLDNGWPHTGKGVVVDFPEGENQ